MLSVSLRDWLSNNVCRLTSSFVYGKWLNGVYTKGILFILTKNFILWSMNICQTIKSRYANAILATWTYFCYLFELSSNLKLLWFWHNYYLLFIGGIDCGNVSLLRFFNPNQTCDSIRMTAPRSITESWSRKSYDNSSWGAGSLRWVLSVLTYLS